MEFRVVRSTAKCLAHTAKVLLDDSQQRRLARPIATDKAHLVERLSGLRVGQVEVQQLELLEVLNDDPGDLHGRCSEAGMLQKHSASQGRLHQVTVLS
jgi:hypothetical protein